ncbi:MAG: ABC transporter permease [Nitrospinae bacterium]|nr:ABC transporter permease [Nitrospinota bacterium]
MNRPAIASGIFLIIVSASALLAPWIAPFPFDLQNPDELLEDPGIKHIMGTDRLGRDLFSRILYGARMSISVGIFTAFAALIIGTIYGAVSGYIGGRTDNFMMRVIDVVYSLPDLLMIILITVILGRGWVSIFLALSLVSWVTAARLIRGEVLRLKELHFVESVKAVGAGHGRILFIHILPNTAGLLIVTLTFRCASAILSESTLSFIGLGLAPPFASWGTLAHDGWSAIKFYPHLTVFPAAAIFLTMLAFNFLGDGLRDAFDPQKRI